MGTVVTVNVQTVKLIDEPKDPILESILNSVRNSRSIADNLVIDIASGFTANVDKYMRYAKKHALSSLSIQYFSKVVTVPEDTIDIIKSIIETELGQNIVIHEALYATTRLKFFAEKWMAEQPQVFWDNLKNDYNIDRYSTFWKIHDAYYIGDPAYLHIDLHNINFALGLNNSANFITTLITDIPYKDSSDMYYFVRYTIEGSTTTIKAKNLNIELLVSKFVAGGYWAYKVADGIHPSLDNVTNSVEIASPLPILSIRRDKVNVVDTESSRPNELRHRRELGEIIGIDIDQFTEDLIDPDDTTSLDNVDQVSILFAMNLNSEEDISLSYLFEHFKQEHYSLHTNVWGVYIDRNLHQDWIDVHNLGQKLYNLNKTTLAGDGFGATFYNNFTTLSIQTGLVTDVNSAPNVGIAIPYVTGLNTGSVGQGKVTMQIVTGASSDEHRVIFRKQVTTIAAGDATNTFAELMVHGLIAEYNVHKGFDETNDYLTGGNHFIRDLSDISKDDFLIPIIYPYAKLFNGAEETAIYYESLRTVIYSYKIFHTPWYQSGVFKTLITVVVVVVSLALGQVELTGSLLSMLATAATFVIEMMAIGFITTKALTVLVDIVGGDIAFALAIISSVATIYYGKTGTLFKLLGVDVTLQMVTTSLTSAININTQKDILHLIDENEEFMKDAAEQQETIDAANDLLDNGSYSLAIYDLVREPIYNTFNEAPDMFFNRTIHTTNPGIVTLDIINKYVDTNLMLPKPETI